MGLRSALPLLAVAACLWTVGFTRGSLADRTLAAAGIAPPQSGAARAEDAKGAATLEEVRAKCATCHPLPPPDILPKSAWRDEMVRMMLIQSGVPEPASMMGQGSASIPLPPDWIRLLRYYEAAAPVRLPDPEPWPAVDDTRVRFTKRRLSFAGGASRPAIANVRFLDADGDGRLDLVASEMRGGHLVAGLAKDGFALKAIAQLQHPSHVERVDLDKDGVADLLVADLGSFMPGDHRLGRVQLLKGDKSGAFTPVTLASGLGRVADARAADFDADGDLDIVVAIFGWRHTGQLALLENRTRPRGPFAFELRVLDPRTGAIHAPVADLDGDRRPDILALFAQEHEAVVVLLNTGRLGFRAQTLYAAPHPNWGSSGIELTDLDADGDADVLLTHGDSFDDNLLKPYHGVQWLENTGSLRFREHTLAALPGAHRALAADLDGDGDNDVIAVALVATETGEARSRLASVVWLEQVAPGVFERRTLEMGEPHHATLDVADYDGDGDVDLAFGWFGFTRPMPAWIDLWENTSRSPPPDR